MTLLRTGTAVLILATLGGCSTFENGYEKLYHALDTRAQLTRDPPAKASDTTKSMSYQQYESERKKLLDERQAQ
jgi:hypothetical protein